MRTPTTSIAITTALFTLLLASSCKPTEANYKAAYEAAKQKSEESSGIEGTIYERIRKEAINSYIMVHGDTIPLMTVAVKCTPGQSVPDSVGQYGVAVAQFKQKFNASSMAARLRAQGYPTATVVENAEPLYYVLAATGDSPERLAAELKKVLSDKPVPTKTPYPTLIKAASHPLRQ